jgi:hypothetical protein
MINLAYLTIIKILKFLDNISFLKLDIQVQLTAQVANSVDC